MGGGRRVVCSARQGKKTHTVPPTGLLAADFGSVKLLPWSCKHGSRVRLLSCFVVLGLPSHPQHELAKRQCTGCPGMVSFYIKGTLQHAQVFLKNIKVSSRSNFLPLRLIITPRFFLFAGYSCKTEQSSPGWDLSLRLKIVLTSDI